MPNRSNADPRLVQGSIAVTVLTQIPRQRLSDLLCSAVEGGTGYWAQVSDMTRTANSDYVSVRFHEIERLTPRASRAKPIVKLITLEEMARGLELASTLAPQHFADFMAENDDAVTADVIVQLAMFGEVVYG